jgi:TRAP-type uncharacterized transport system fused permease subunit
VDPAGVGRNLRRRSRHLVDEDQHDTRRGPIEDDLRALTIGVESDMLPILLFSAGAGIVVGALNLAGLGFHVTEVLARIAADWGVVAMLAATAMVAIIPGMGMPTAAVYVILSVILARPSSASSALRR